MQTQLARQPLEDIKAFMVKVQKFFKKLFQHANKDEGEHGYDSNGGRMNRLLSGATTYKDLAKELLQQFRTGK